MKGFLDEANASLPEVNAFIQWKNTDACFDFYCDCGAHCHYDGYFAYTVKCPHCSQVYEMPHILYPRKAEDRTNSYWRNNPKILEEDEDFRPSSSPETPQEPEPDPHR